MPYLEGFSDNPFKTRSDFVRAGVALVKPLEAYKSPGQARIKLPTATGTGFSEQAAQLEGYARPLWLVANLFKEPGDDPTLQLESWIRGLKNGTDPAFAEYWGDLGDFDQRMVEMESIAYTLLISPERFSFSDDAAAKANLITWLRQINSRDMSRNNWRWFRVFVNLALHKSLGVPLSEVEQFIHGDLDILDSFYLGNGWSSDGLWGADRKQADYYSGSFAIQLAQLLFVSLASDFDPDRAARYVDQARQFAVEFWRYFNADGAAIPFGRSLTYRFAFAAFWSACAQANVRLPAPLNDPGTVKGLLLRHFRWWSRHQDMFSPDGSLTIGYTYPNLYLSEDYNSPQSVYWCLKPFVVLSLTESHPFWKSEEKPYPAILSPHIHDLALLEKPRHLLCNAQEHHFLLSTGQGTKWNHKGKMAKYGKLAYSSSFAFSVPVAGQILEHIAPDSTLAISCDDGESWKVHWDPYDLKTGSMKLGDTTVPTLSSTWRPFKFLNVEVRTTLVPPVANFPGWHLRMHEIRVRPCQNGLFETLQCVDSGFSASAMTSTGVCLFENAAKKNEDPLASPLDEGIGGLWKSNRSALIVSQPGASGVIDLSQQFPLHQSVQDTEGCIIKPHANTNILFPRSLIPSIRHTIQLPTLNDKTKRESTLYTIVTGVFAVEARSRSTEDILKMWQAPPQGQLS